MKRILILHTGGTIGMKATPDGLRPMAGFAAVLEEHVHVAAAQPVDFDVVEMDRLIDSADLAPDYWLQIAGRLLRHWDEYDGFVVLHGTDTMAWTAAALSFMLRGMDKPVILTGAQVPLLAARSDAAENLEMALALAADSRICEVGICFGRKLLRGNRAIKIATSRFDAFASPDYPPLVETGIEMAVYEGRLLSRQKRAFSVPACINPQAVAVLTIYPGIAAGMIEAVCAVPGLRGLVLQTYGVGNMPQADKRLVAALEAAAVRGVVLVNITRCMFGSVAQDVYATGTALARLGVVPGGDMTLEAAFAKLHLLIAQGFANEKIRKEMLRSYSGEITQASL